LFGPSPLGSPSTAAPTAAPPFPARFGRVDPSVFEVAEGHDDLGLRAAGAQEFDDLRAQRRGRVAGQGRDALGIEQDHAGPADARDRTPGRGELHDEEIALVIQRVLAELELRERLAAQILQHGEVLFSALEGLLHRDHAVSEHACLRHTVIDDFGLVIDDSGPGKSSIVNLQSSIPPHPITSPLSRKISLAMISRWISLVPS
jgi:hypothetical protein